MKILSTKLLLTVMFGWLAVLCSTDAQGIKQLGALNSGNEPSIQASSAIKNSIVIPLKTLYNKDKAPLVKELEGIAHDLYKLAHKKVAIKFVDYIKSRKSFEQGLLSSDFPVIYLRVWKQEIDKRLKKVKEYEVRLGKIAQRLTVFSAKLDGIKKSNNKLYSVLASYVTSLKSTINIVKIWLKKSDQLFKEELTMVKDRENRFKKAGILGL